MADPAMQQVYKWHQKKDHIHEMLVLCPEHEPAPAPAPTQGSDASAHPRTDEELAADLGAALPGLTATTVLFIYNLVAFLCNMRRFRALLEAADPRGVVRGFTMDIPAEVAEQKQLRVGGEPVEVRLSGVVMTRPCPHPTPTPILLNTCPRHPPPPFPNTCAHATSLPEHMRTRRRRRRHRVARARARAARVRSG